mmetsp:Transcript_33316/g.106357  ORF Transcript_33316/g.106357 Transcript_33316/m.106357 type:complete len:160 (+) Transcript_33316:40-519(+)|eukprot:CAMPEP_0118895928 /NCGR_PEP_ID=MMETSP1166-20130328/4050_1 /TAXON_ID=1104430 /ORGANISM="Chrysoreinhardia sp, Strain CCMP3193" /LENGTH=159 /DNA_ID=CAMNT_0006834979 /DNA_START=10 /DNA_END=489 /DNA_ORIENTATION=+
MKVCFLCGYLTGRWSLVKRVDYEDGGTWRGEARFDGRRLTESGRFYFDRDPATGLELNAKPQTFRFDDDRVDVSWDDGGPFYSFDPKALPEVSFTPHYCGPDVYRGELAIIDGDRFDVRWKVSGSKQGTIHQHFRRIHQVDEQKEPDGQPDSQSVARRA